MSPSWPRGWLRPHQYVEARLPHASKSPRGRQRPRPAWRRPRPWRRLRCLDYTPRWAAAVRPRCVLLRRVL